MKSKFKKIRTDRFIVMIPKGYKVRKRSLYLMGKLLFSFHKRRIKKEFPSLLENSSPNFESLKGHYSFEVKMVTHSFIFHTEIGNRKPEDLAGFIESQTRYLPILKDITINDCHGKMCGDYSDQMTWIDWWFKKGDCMICFNLRGIGMPAQDIKDDVRDILNSLEYIG